MKEKYDNNYKFTVLECNNVKFACTFYMIRVVCRNTKCRGQLSREMLNINLLIKLANF